MLPTREQRECLEQERRDRLEKEAAEKEAQEKAKKEADFLAHLAEKDRKIAGIVNCAKSMVLSTIKNSDEKECFVQLSEAKDRSSVKVDDDLANETIRRLKAESPQEYKFEAVVRDGSYEDYECYGDGNQRKCWVDRYLHCIKISWD